MSEKRRLDAMFSVRLSIDELRQVQRLAAASGLSVSAYIRRRVLAGVQPTICERMGCMKEGTSYHRWGSAISSVGWNYNVTAATNPPDAAITLCNQHALEAFGVAWGAA